MCYIDGSKEFGNIISFDTKEGKIRNIDKPQFECVPRKRGYKHLQLPKLKEMCKKHKLKVGGKKEQLVERLENGIMKITVVYRLIKNDSSCIINF